jgi:Peptidase family M23
LPSVGVLALEPVRKACDCRGSRASRLWVPTVLFMLQFSGPVVAQPPVLQVPIKCMLGTDCFVQNFPDVDATPRSGKDFTCGNATYDTHDGTDIRVLSVEASRGVAVIASAPGVVRGVRNDAPERLVRTPEDKAAVSGKECGNGVAIQHAGGWETQYCHMRRGSIRVKPGDKVVAGTELGEVGVSGHTQFAHVHLTVRRGKIAVDPFTGDEIGRTGAVCGAGKPKPLWSPAAAEVLGGPRTVILETLFADRLPLNEQLEEGHAGLAPFARGSGVVMLLVRIMHARKGDMLRVRMTLPSGSPFDQTVEFEKDSAVRIMSGGRKRGGADWPPGLYLGEAEVLREGGVVARGRAEVTLE